MTVASMLVELALEAEPVLWRFLRAQAVHFGEQIFEEIHGTRVVGVGEGGTGNWLQAQVVQPVSDSGQGAQTVTHGTPCRKLDEGHERELLLEPKLA